jgi:hypothetical protein
LRETDTRIEGKRLSREAVPADCAILPCRKDMSQELGNKLFQVGKIFVR